MNKNANATKIQPVTGANATKWGALLVAIGVSACAGCQPATTHVAYFQVAGMVQRLGIT